jgi:predicted DNA-binding transcriptional regulator YafY
VYDDVSPTARTLLTLELIQNSPGITAERLSYRLGQSDRAVRRYVGILREAGVPIDSTRGPYGGYRIGRGHRVPPLMFTLDEALGLVMAVLESDRGVADPDGGDPVASAIGKIIRVLPEPVAGPADAVRRVRTGVSDTSTDSPDPQTAVFLAQACSGGRRLRFEYRIKSGRTRTMEVDPWSVVVRHARWYLLCWSHTSGARRVLRIDKIGAIEILDDEFSPPDDLDPLRAVEEQLSEGWRYQVEVVVEAPLDQVARWMKRSQCRLEEIDGGRTRLLASTDEPFWYVEQLIVLRADFHVVGCEEIRSAVATLGQRLVSAARPSAEASQTSPRVGTNFPPRRREVPAEPS